MLLYRAINLNDINDLENNRDIEYSLVRTNRFKLRKNCKIYYDLCIAGKREYAFDIITGHIAGGRLRVGLSSWISMTKDFCFAYSEYAVPQSGAYNEAGIRKPIIVIDVDKVLTNEVEIKKLKENKKEDNLIIDLSNGNLNKLYGKAFMSEAFNKNMPGYDDIRYKKYENNPDIYNVKGLSNFALYAKEVLFFKQIKNSDVKCLLYPILQDILYGCEIDIEKNINFLMDNINNIYNFLNNVDKLYLKNIALFKYLYPDYKTGNNLTDYLYDNYDTIEGQNIYEKYNYLKNCKKQILDEIIHEYNKKFNFNLKLLRIIDDELLVLDLNNLIKITNKQIYDLLILRKDGLLYKYDSKTKKFISKSNKISKENIKTLIKK